MKLIGRQVSLSTQTFHSFWVNSEDLRGVVGRVIVGKTQQPGLLIVVPQQYLAKDVVSREFSVIEKTLGYQIKAVGRTFSPVCLRLNEGRASFSTPLTHH